MLPTSFVIDDTALTSAEPSTMDYCGSRSSRDPQA
jgi:hypothetical protein